jgi:hypothetical protein
MYSYIVRGVPSGEGDGECKVMKARFPNGGNPTSAHIRRGYSNEEGYDSGHNARASVSSGVANVGSSETSWFRVTIYCIDIYYFTRLSL